MRSNVMLGLGSSVRDLWGLRMNTVMMSVVLLTGLFALVRDALPKMRHSLYFLAAAKCSLLVGLFLGTIFREGAFRGIGQLPIWKLESFASLPMWQDVIAFAAFGTGLGGYGISFISAHNSFQNNFFIDLVYILVVDALTCFGTASVIFFMLGSYGHKTGLEIDQIMGSNVVQDLAFIEIPQALLSTETTGALLVLFLLFLAFTGLGPLLLTTELVVEVVGEEFPHSHVNKRTDHGVTSAVCLLASCVYATLAGPYIEVLVTEYLYHVVGFANIIGELLVVLQLYGGSK
ncbi:sodium- and chloride-dependent neutral and basic amino acid transporter B(0+)-like [Amblyomma americanum]